MPDTPAAPTRMIALCHYASWIIGGATGRICDAQFGTLFRYDGKLLHRVAGVGTPPALVEFQKQRGLCRRDN